VSGRGALLRAAAEAAIERVHPAFAEGGDGFATTGESLFWIHALAQTNAEEGGILDAIAFARHVVAHGAIVAFPALADKGFGEGGFGSGLFGHRVLWRPRGEIRLEGSLTRSTQALASAYDEHLAGKDVVQTLRLALAAASGPVHDSPSPTWEDQSGNGRI
jgi:hypothetical protein